MANTFRITLAAVLRVHSSALKHGCTIEDISHALDMAIYEVVVDEGHEPSKLIIGPDGAGNLLELLGGEFGDGLRIWHADRCRPAYLALLPKPGGDA